MDTLPFPSLTLGIAALLGGVGWSLIRDRQPHDARRTGLISASLALVAFALAAWQAAGAGAARLLDPWCPWLEADSLDSVPMAFFAALTVVMLALAPRRDLEGRAVAGMLLLSAATQMAYGAANLVMLAAGWWLTCVPFVTSMFGKGPGKRIPVSFLVASCVALTLGILVLHATALEDLSHTSVLAFSLLMLAVILRKGVFPLHFWQIHAFEHGPLLPVTLLFNGHLGALLIARSEAIALPQTARNALSILGMAALATAVITSLRGFVEKKPRRLLALIGLSQASFILAGLATSNEAGITGALVHWLVVAAASTGLACVVRVLEVRVKDALNPTDHLGLGVKGPRLATLFLICGLALIGLPGTLGYCAEDMLFHGALESHPLLGFALPLATAFNAIHLVRLFSLLFMGVLPKHVTDVPDALPRERWPLSACIAFLIIGGLLPAGVIAWRAPAARVIATALGVTSGHGHAPHSSPEK